MRELLTSGAHSVVIDGVRQAYFVAGSGPVCLVHSGGPGIDWEYLRMPLLERHLTMVYLEPVGSGHSGFLADGNYNVRRYGDFAVKLLDQLQLDRVHFIGHSHGGFVGLQFALDHPERLNSLVAFATAPLIGPELWAEAGRRVDEFAARRAGRPEAEQVRVAWAQGSGDDHDSHVDWLQKMLPIYVEDFADHPDKYAAWAAGLDITIDPGRKPEEWDIRARLSEITTRTLVLVGEHDFICGTKWADELAAGIPAAELVVVPGTGHMVHVEAPTDFANLIGDFVAG